MNRKKHFLAGLCLYLTQAQLSIHRSEWKEFKNYYSKSMVDVETVLSLLNKYWDSEAKLGTKKLTKFCFPFSVFPVNWPLTNYEKSFITYWLNSLKNSLVNNNEPSKKEVANLRLNLAYAAGIISDKSIYARKFDGPITHLNESKTVESKTIDQILKAPWNSPV